MSEQSLEVWGVYGALDFLSEKEFTIEFNPNGELDFERWFKTQFGAAASKKRYDGQITGSMQITYRDFVEILALPFGAKKFCDFLEPYLDRTSPQNDSLLSSIENLGDAIPGFFNSTNYLSQHVLVVQNTTVEALMDRLPASFFNYRRRRSLIGQDHEIPEIDTRKRSCTPPIRDFYRNLPLIEKLLLQDQPPLLRYNRWGEVPARLHPIDIIVYADLPREEYQVRKVK